MLSRHVLFERAAFPTSHQMHIHCDVWTWDIHEWRAICSVDDVLFLYHGCQSESPATTCKISGVRQWPGKFPTRLWSGNYQQNHWLLSLWTKLSDQLHLFKEVKLWNQNLCNLWFQIVSRTKHEGKKRVPWKDRYIHAHCRINFIVICVGVERRGLGLSSLVKVSPH